MPGQPPGIGTLVPFGMTGEAFAHAAVDKQVEAPEDDEGHNEGGGQQEEPLGDAQVAAAEQGKYRDEAIEEAADDRIQEADAAAERDERGQEKARAEPLDRRGEAQGQRHEEAATEVNMALLSGCPRKAVARKKGSFITTQLGSNVKMRNLPIASAIPTALLVTASRRNPYMALRQ